MRALARTLLAGPPASLVADVAITAIEERCATLLGRHWPWVRPLAKRYLKAFAGTTRPRHRDVVQFLRDDGGLRRAWSAHPHEILLTTWFTDAQTMQPVAACAAFDLPVLASVGDLAAWLDLDSAELDWLADLKGIAPRAVDERLRHYHVHLHAKRSGGLRIIEAPKLRLKQIQRRILRHIVSKVPAHPAAHGFVPGRSTKTFAAPHVGHTLVLRMDLKDFFPSIPGTRISALFRTLGYPESVADKLTGLCTTIFPGTRDESWRRQYGRRHLPQGAPTSPMLANLCMYRADCRLAALAHSAGATYSRYADDLAFSGDARFARRSERFSLHAAAVLLDEGFTVEHRKTRSMRQGARQQLAGVVVNAGLHVPRDEYDRLKAILTNCRRLGPESQNRAAHPDFRAHLEGRVSYVEMIQPLRGERLRHLLDQVPWP